MLRPTIDSKLGESELLLIIIFSRRCTCHHTGSLSTTGLCVYIEPIYVCSEGDNFSVLIVSIVNAVVKLYTERLLTVDAMSVR